MARNLLHRAFLVAGVSLLALIPDSKAQPAHASPTTPDVELSLRAVPKEVEIFPGTKTRVWSYEGALIQGPADSLTPSESYLGPTLRFRTGQRVRIHFSNELPEESIIHWHGLDVPAEMDGHPHSTVGEAGKFSYEFTVENRAGLYWYHPHPHMRTGYQVYQGLAGLFIVSDAEEAALELPRGESESLLVIQDRKFDDQKQLQYLTSPMERHMGVFGDTLLINGSLNLEKTVPRGPHRVRILNGSNARVYHLGWEDGRPLQLIGTDGGLLSEPVTRSRVMLAPGERLDVWVDFSGAEAGAAARLMSYPLVEGRGDPFAVFQFRFSDARSAAAALPQALSRIKKIDAQEAVNATAPKSFAVTMDRNIGWTINGRGYEMHEVAPEEIIKLGTTEIWEFANQSGMPHPLHIHGQQFQVLERTSGRFTSAFDGGWKDTVLLLPGDRVKLIQRFPRPGWFVYHCHILEHEDMSMMRNYRVIE